MKQIGPFKIIAGPFEGGFGIVYKVFDTDSGDEFALKTLKVFVTTSAPQLQLFRREISHWKSIPTHPNVVRAIRAFEHEDRPYVLIEWVSGGTLQERIPNLKSADPTNTGAAEAIEVLRQMCDGMVHVHSSGLIHGDLKPGNILMWHGRSPQITDFGFARAIGAGPEVLAGGTHRYMAPELKDYEPTIASDVYAGGVIFHDVLEQFRQAEFGVAEARELADEMCDKTAVKRPSSFAIVRDRLADILSRAKFAPVVPLRTGDRHTWDEQHAAVVPARSRFNEAMSDLAAGRRSDAKAKLKEVIAQQPDMVDAQVQLAVLLAEEGSSSEALEHLKAAEAAQPDKGRLLNIASVYARLSRATDAERILDILQKESEDEPRIWMVRSGLAEGRGDLTRAIDYCRKWLERGGGDRARYSLGRLLKDAGLIEQAIAELTDIKAEDRAIAISVQQLLARIYVDTQRYDDAIRELRELLKLNLGAEAQAYYYAEMGYTYKARGFFEAAVRSYEKCLALKPNDRQALEGLRQAQAGVDKEVAD